MFVQEEVSVAQVRPALPQAAYHPGEGLQPPQLASPVPAPSLRSRRDQEDEQLHAHPHLQICRVRRRRGICVGVLRIILLVSVFFFAEKFAEKKNLCWLCQLI